MNAAREELLDLLLHGEIEISGEFLWGSNYTFLTKVRQAPDELIAVYKPTRGERPLWDFPTASLARREAAAFWVSEALGWDLVPPTVYRRKGPLGAGSLQLFIEHDPQYHYFNFSTEDRARLRPVVVFDLLINNADRKGSHILRAADGHLWLIDHGVSFHVEDKLRTVIWDYVDEPIPENLCMDLSNLIQRLGDLRREPGELARQLLEFISPAELRALARRADYLMKSGRFPAPDPFRRPFPWPEI
jgi:hypothetical protein